MADPIVSLYSHAGNRIAAKNVLALSIKMNHTEHVAINKKLPLEKEVNMTFIHGVPVSTFRLKKYTIGQTCFFLILDSCELYNHQKENYLMLRFFLNGQYSKWPLFSLNIISYLISKHFLAA